MVSHNRGVNLPPPDGERTFRVTYARPSTGLLDKKNGPVDLTFLQEHWWGCEVHWLRDEQTKKWRSRLHLRMEKCPWCEGHAQIRWAGYVPCWDNFYKELVIALLSPEAARQMEALLIPFHGIMGQRLVLSRISNEPNSLVTVGRSAFPPDLPLPPAFDMQPTLRRLFGLHVNPDLLVEGADIWGDRPVLPLAGGRKKGGAS